MHEVGGVGEGGVGLTASAEQGPLTDQVNALVCGTDGRDLVVLVAIADNGAQVWDLRTRQLRYQLGDRWVSDVELGLLDGLSVAITAYAYAVRIWNLGRHAFAQDPNAPQSPCRRLRLWK